MRRAIGSAALGALAAAVALAAPAVPAAASPAAVLDRFAAAVERGDGAAACRALTPDLVRLRHYPEHVGRHSLDPASWTPAAVLAGCGAEWTTQFTGADVRVALRDVRTVERRGRVAHLRLRVLVGRRVDERADAFLVRQRDGWRIASLGGPIATLPTNGSSEPREPFPDTFAQFAGYRRDLARDLRLVRRVQARYERAFERVRTPVATTPLACTTQTDPTSEIADRARDVAWEPGGLGEPPPEQDAAAGGDIRAANLTRTPDGLCLTVRMAGPVPRELDLSLELAQRDPRGFVVSAGVGAELVGGWAFSTEQRGEGRRVLRRADVAVVGDTLTLRVPADRLPVGPDTAIGLDRPLRWTVSTSRLDPEAPEGYRTDRAGPVGLRP